MLITPIDVLTAFHGAKIVAQDDDWLAIPKADRDAIEAEASRWKWDEKAETWKMTGREPGGCVHCSKPHTPSWRRGGKIIEARWSDGRVTKLCHYCGREVIDANREVNS